MLLKSKIQVLFEKRTEEIKEDISIVKLNISNLHKAVITLPGNSYDARIVWSWHLQIILSGVALKTLTCRQLRLFTIWRERHIIAHTVDNEVSTLPRLTCPWESVNWAKSKVQLSAVMAVLAWGSTIVDVCM